MAWKAFSGTRIVQNMYWVQKDRHILTYTKTHLAMVNVIFAEMCGHRQLQEKQLSDLILT